MPDHTLISIVSEQAIPNVMAVLQDERYFQHLEFIVSADASEPDAYDTTFYRIYERLKAFLEAKGRVVTCQPPVHSYDMNAVLRACQAAVDAHLSAGRKVIFNITGGTKVMAIAAYLCAQRNHLEVIYVESRDRRLISLPPSDDFSRALETGDFTSTRTPFVEEQFRPVDVNAYVLLYGQKVSSSVCVNDLPEESVVKAQEIARTYGLLRPVFQELQRQINECYKERRMTWPFEFACAERKLKEKQALERLARHDVFSWHQQRATLILNNKEQQEFFKGDWVEVYVLHSLAESKIFHDVRGKVQLEGADGEWDIMLTANAKLAIIECKSDARLGSREFGKIRAVQRDLGGPYAHSFFIRSGRPDKKMRELAALYGISNILDFDDLPNISEIVAREMRISTSG